MISSDYTCDGQLNIFDYLLKDKPIECDDQGCRIGRIKLLSLFSGIGAFEKALEKMGVPYDLINYCEIDRYASKAYSLIHNLDENMNLKDVRQIKSLDLPQDIDVVTYGFPCQDISNCGKKKGFKDENGDLTRSGLFFEALRIIEGGNQRWQLQKM